jgi:hypothetical protein
MRVVCDWVPGSADSEQFRIRWTADGPEAALRLTVVTLRQCTALLPESVARIAREWVERDSLNDLKALLEGRPVAREVKDEAGLLAWSAGPLEGA